MNAELIELARAWTIGGNFGLAVFMPIAFPMLARVARDDWTSPVKDQRITGLIFFATTACVIAVLAIQAVTGELEAFYRQYPFECTIGAAIGGAMSAVALIGNFVESDHPHSE